MGTIALTNLGEVGDYHITASTLPSSVGGTCHKVRPHRSSGLRACVRGVLQFIFERDELMRSVVNSAIIRPVKLFGYTPAHNLLEPTHIRQTGRYNAIAFESWGDQFRAPSCHHFLHSMAAIRHQAVVGSTNIAYFTTSTFSDPLTALSLPSLVILSESPLVQATSVKGLFYALTFGSG